MKVLYIESKLKNLEYVLDEDEIVKLPKELFLAFTIQYKDLAKSIKKQLEQNKIKVSSFQQILGCTKLQSKIPILLIGSGKFHSLNLYFQTPALYLLQGKEIIKIPYHDIEVLKMRQKTAYIKFLAANNIGILVSTKPGQENLDVAFKLKTKLQKKSKNVFIFLSNNISPFQFENFKIDSWINTACSGMTLDDPNILNFSDIPSI